MLATFGSCILKFTGCSEVRKTSGETPLVLKHDPFPNISSLKLLQNSALTLPPINTGAVCCKDASITSLARIVKGLPWKFKKRSPSYSICIQVKIIGRELSAHEMWKQSHCRKGSRPLDKHLIGSSSLLLDVDSEGDVEEILVWVDDRADETWVKYNGYLVEKYGKERSEHPKFDDDLWYRASGGKNKGKVYGLGNVKDSRVHDREDPEIEKLNLVIKELVKEKDEDKERFEEIIVGLVAEKEKYNADK